MKYLIVGLGNPGTKYLNTRHNIGFQVLDFLSNDLQVSFSADKIEENAKELLSTLIKLKPTASKGVYVKSIFMSSTMSPSIAVDSKAAVN